MTDISKCFGIVKQEGKESLTCSKRQHCRRYTVRADIHQSYLEPAPDFTEKKGCEMFWDNGRP